MSRDGLKCFLPSGVEVVLLGLSETDRRDMHAVREVTLRVGEMHAEIRHLVVPLSCPGPLVYVPLHDVRATPEGIRASFVAMEAEVETRSGPSVAVPAEAIVTTARGGRHHGVCTDALSIGEDVVLILELDAFEEAWEGARIALSERTGRSASRRVTFVAECAVSTGGGVHRVRARRIEGESVDPDVRPSCLAVAEGTRIPVRRAGEKGAWVDADVDGITTTGFVARLAVAPSEAPVCVEVGGFELRFRCSPYGDRFRFDLWTEDLGDRVRWYGYLCRLAELTTPLHPKDAPDVALLLHETGYHSQDVMRDRVRLAPRDSPWYVVEHALPRTHVRLVGRGAGNRVGGHCLIARTSDRLWSACDVVRSGLYQGRWNMEGVAPWLRSMAEMLDADSEALIQWTFLTGGGVWDAFAKRVSETSGRVASRQRAWIASAERSTTQTEDDPFVWHPLGPTVALVHAGGSVRLAHTTA